ncbi:hypothetical protein N9C83_06665 [Opitutales bacterium]|jgi:hypothetical protein|nr:hypothetical protein [Opitutales bacterium]
MNKLLAISLIILGSSSFAADWNNPGNKYANAYKAYEGATAPIEADNIKHFVYFTRDREAVREHPLLDHSRFSGAQIMYAWAQLESSKDNYDFSIIQEDYEYLKSKGKKLFIQLQDATFDIRYRGVPGYLNAPDYDGGSIPQKNDDGVEEGWTAKRWNGNVRKRFASLLEALGKDFDGKIEGINLQETAVGVSNEQDPSFTPAVYAESVKQNMLALKKAFPRSAKLQYANFMPGEWLPWEDEGYLRSIYEYGESIGVGLGAPDLMVRRKGQLNHALAMMHENEFTAPLGIAIQDGNYIGQTGADFPAGSEQPKAADLVKANRKNIVPLLHAFANDFLKVQYMFWVNQEPYFEEDVLPSFKE